MEPRLYTCSAATRHCTCSR